MPAPLHSNRCNDALIEPSNLDVTRLDPTLDKINYEDSDRKVLINCLENKEKKEDTDTT